MLGVGFCSETSIHQSRSNDCASLDPDGDLQLDRGTTCVRLKKTLFQCDEKRRTSCIFATPISARGALRPQGARGERGLNGNVRGHPTNRAVAGGDTARFKAAGRRNAKPQVRGSDPLREKRSFEMGATSGARRVRISCAARPRRSGALKPGQGDDGGVNTNRILQLLADPSDRKRRGGGGEPTLSPVRVGLNQRSGCQEERCFLRRACCSFSPSDPSSWSRPA